MLRVATQTKLSPEKVIGKAVTFFGNDGFKLNITSQTETTASFEDDVGSVTVAANKENGKTSVELTTREWESQVEQFIMMIR